MIICFEEVRQETWTVTNWSTLKTTLDFLLKINVINLNVMKFQDFGSHTWYICTSLLTCITSLGNV